MSGWQDMKAKYLEDEATRTAYDELEQRMRLVRAVVVARNARGWSQRDLANAAGLKQPAIARFEKADSDPRLGTVTKILSALELQLTIDPDGVPAATAPGKRPRVSGHGKVLTSGRGAAAAAASRRTAQAELAKPGAFADVNTSGKGAFESTRTER